MKVILCILVLGIVNLAQVRSLNISKEDSTLVKALPSPCGKPPAFRSFDSPFDPRLRLGYPATDFLNTHTKGCDLMFRISKDTPAYYLTSMAKNRLPVFRKPALKDLVCAAINEARLSASFLLFAYVIMPEHLHVIVGSELKPSKVVQYINGIIARRVIDYLKNNGHETSLEMLSPSGRKAGGFPQGRGTALRMLNQPY